MDLEYHLIESENWVSFMTAFFSELTQFPVMTLIVQA
jgi:hypothetical protein